MGYPPAEVADTIRDAFKPIAKTWPYINLWVPVVHERPEMKWFRAEIRRGLWGLGRAYAVTRGAHISLSSFSMPPSTVYAPTPPRRAATRYRPVDRMDALFAMARMRLARQDELAAVLGEEELDIPHLFGEGFLAEKRVQRAENRGRGKGVLQEDVYVEIRRKGLILVREQWGLTPGHLPPRELTRNSGRVHLHISRMAPRIVRMNWGDRVEIYGGWSEPKLSYTLVRPDALVWGTWDGAETLFWLEVESGHRSMKSFAERLQAKMQICAVLSHLRVVMAVLSTRWIIQAVTLLKPPPNVAVVVGRWKGRDSWLLPVPEFGRIRVARKARVR